MTHELRDYSGGAVATTITASISAGATSIAIAASTNWPSGGVAGPFFAVIDRGTASEERITVTSRSGTTLTVGTRGADGTTATTHSSGASIEHCFSATDADEANSHYANTALDHHTQYHNDTRGDARYPTKASLTTKGDIWAASAASTPARTAVGSNGKFLVADSTATTGLAWKTLSGTVVAYDEHTWIIPGTVAVESGDTDFIVPKTIHVGSGETVELERVIHKINSGTSVTWDLTVNGTGATGFTSLSTTTTNTSTDPTNVALANNDKVKPDVSAVSGTPKNWEVTVVIKRTRALTLTVT